VKEKKPKLFSKGKKLKMPKITGKARIAKKTRQYVAVISAVLAFIVSILLFIIWPNTAIDFLNEIFLGALFAVMVPSAILDFINQRWFDAIEQQLPVLVRGVSEVQETGLTFIKGFEKVAEYGMVQSPLREEVKQLSVHMSWGLSFEQALKEFKDRIASPAVNRFCTLILEAGRSGGQIRKVFGATSTFMEEMKEMDKETTAQMRPYLIIIYTAFFVFVFTSIILLSAFFVPLESYTQIINPVMAVGPREFRDFFYRTMFVSGLLGGLMAGKIGERRVIPPNWMVLP
jgi:flagellar protein FlaJ